MAAKHAMRLLITAYLNVISNGRSQDFIGRVDHEDDAFYADHQA